MTHTAAAILTEPRGSVAVREVPLRSPGEGEVLVRMEACGLCHSDVFVSGLEKLPHVPLILGHEGIGRVEEVGPAVAGFQPGDRAGMTFLASTCGTCDLCRSGRERFCGRQLNFGYTLDGVLANRAVVTAARLARVPGQLAAHEAAPLCCAGWTAFGAVREAGLQPGQTIALFGMGGLGHMAVQFARARGLRVAAADISGEKLEMARHLGADSLFSAADAGKSIQKECGGADAALVLTASAAAIQQAFRSLKRTGTLVLVGLSHQGWELPVVDAVLKGITVRGSYLGTAADLEEVFRLAAEGNIRVHATTHRLEETPQLLDRMRRSEVLGRAVITFF